MPRAWRKWLSSSKQSYAHVCPALLALDRLPYREAGKLEGFGKCSKVGPVPARRRCARQRHVGCRTLLSQLGPLALRMVSVFLGGVTSTLLRMQEAFASRVGNEKRSIELESIKRCACC